MKLWSDTQMFFVVDTEFCQNEADDPQDAIVYFSPQDTPDTTKCTLCCHVMGICRFMNLGFSPVSLIRLSKGKFAIRSLGKYLLALRGGPDMPDSILQRQLNSMIDIFLLLYNDFETVSNDCNSRSDFLDQMAAVWSFLLPISQHRGDNLSLTFNIIPSLDLPKTAGLLFLQASEFLQACQRFPGVYAGTLFCDQKVLCSQLPVSILSKLAFVCEKQRWAGKAAPVSFDLPGSVKLLFIYLSDEDGHTLDVGRMISRRRITVPGEGTTLENSESGLPDQKLSENSSSPVGDLSVVPLEADESGTKDLSIHIPHNGECKTDITVNCPNTSSDAIAANIAQDTLDASGSSSDATLTQDTEMASSVTDENYISNPASFASSKAAHSLDTVNNFKQFILYVQAYNDTVLCLILDDGCNEDPTTIHGLWKLGMNTLMTLETDVRSCLEMSPSKEQDEKTDPSYMFMQYDSKLNNARGDLKVSKGSTMERQIFNRSAQLLHEEFVRNPQLYEATVCARELVIYGHRVGARETYFHSKETSLADHNAGFPLQSDQMCTVATRARKKLEKERRLLLL